MAVLAIGCLGFLATILGSLQLANQTRKISEATDQAMAVIEAFRYRASESFEDTMTDFAVDGDLDFDGQELYRRLPEMEIETEVVLDETRFEPRVDLNGDGDCDDRNLLPSEVLASFLVTEVSWDQGEHRLSFVTLVARTNLTATPPVDTGDDVGGGADDLGGFGDLGGGPPDDPVSFAVGWVSVDDELGSLSLGVHVERDTPIVGIEVDPGRNNLSIAEIRVSGETVFSRMIDPPATRTVIPTQPFMLDAGLNTIDSILFVDHRGRPGSVGGRDVTVTFYLECGRTAVVTVQG